MTPRIVWLASYPKSGNTWVRAFLSQLLQSEDDPFDVNNIATHGISSNRHMLDDALGFHTGDLTQQECARLRPIVYRWSNTRLKEPAYIKAHDACDRLADGDWLMAPEATDRVLYIIRNPLDVAISMAHFSVTTLDKSIKNLGRPMMQLVQDKPVKQTAQVAQKLGTWSHHVLSWIDNPHFNTQVVRYEDLLASPQESFAGLCTFLNLDVEPERIETAIEQTSFNALQKQEKLSGFREKPQKTERFFRNGKMGEWKTALTAAQIDKVLSDHLPVMQRFGYADKNGTPQLY